MLILHGAIKEGRFILWAESSESADFRRTCAVEEQDAPQRESAEFGAGQSEKSDTDAATRRSGSFFQSSEEVWEFADQAAGGETESGVLQPASLAFAASPEKLLQALAEAGLCVPSGHDPVSAIVCLVASDGTTLASSPIIGRSIEDADPASLGLTPSMVPALYLNTGEVVEILCSCLDDGQLAPGLSAGDDLRFWALAMRFAAMLVAKQQFLPGLRLSSDGAFASWDPVFTGEDGDRLSQLARGMPGSCLAGEIDSFDDSYGKRAFELLVKFINQVCDRLVKDALAEKLPPHVEPLLESLEEKGASNLHQRWMDALVGTDPKLEATPEELAKLSAQIAEWRRPIAVASDAPYRLCLRLEEPAMPLYGEHSGQSEDLELDDGTNSDSGAVANADRQSSWYVRFLLQSLRDPGVLVPISTVLSPSFEDLPLLRGGRVSAREYLFRSLGQAARLCPHVEKSFADAIPCGFELDTSGAHQFLSQTAAALKNAGFSIQLPDWWTRKQKIKAKARVFGASNQGTLFGLGDLAQFDWQLALGGLPMSIDELEKLTQLKIPLIRWRGMWVELNPEQIAPVLSFFGKGQESSNQDLIKLALGAAPLPEGVEFDGITGEGRIVDVIRQLQGQSDFTELAVDHRFNGELRPYQIRGMSWLAFLKELGFGACLADDMGLGKTVQTLAFVQKCWHEQPKNRKQPTLLVCPTSVIGNWQKEAKKFTPELKVLVHHGTDRLHSNRFAGAARASALVVTSYALLHKDYDDLAAVNWQSIILDEAQNVKNPETHQAIAACSLPSQFRIALTGTPVENSIGDLWSLMNFLNPGWLGTRNAFKERFFKPIQIYQEQEKIEHLKRLTGPFILRRLKTDKSIVPDLPEKYERKTRCHLTKEQASLYAAVVGEATESLDVVCGMKRKSLVLTTMLRLKQICDHPALVVQGSSKNGLRSGKLKRLTEMLESVLSSGERALVFTQFAQMGEMIQNHLQHMTGKEVLFLHGGTEREQRERMVEKFQSRGDGPQLFVLSLKAGGTGLNLTKANHVFHFDRWWNPAVENQATDRAFRIGQENDVAVHKFICAGTLEENIDEIIERKKFIASNTVGAGEGWLTELSTRELRNIFALRETALVD
jgi:SNF2 family DNA or RNA helicase